MAEKKEKTVTKENVELTKEKENKIDNIEVFKKKEDVTVEAETKIQTKEATEKKVVTPIGNLVTIDPDEKTNVSFTAEQKYEEDSIWHDIKNLHDSKHICTGVIEGYDESSSHSYIVYTSIYGKRVAIPIEEMGIVLANEETGDGTPEQRRAKIVNNMLFSEIDFIIKGYDKDKELIAASRAEALIEKRRRYYGHFDSTGNARIIEGRPVEARVLSVHEKRVRVEVFGVETSIMARDLDWSWTPNAKEIYSNGDVIKVMVTEITYPNEPVGSKEWLDNIKIRVDAKQFVPNRAHDAFEKVKVEGKYVGTIADVHKGVYYINLTSGAKAIAHTASGSSLPMAKDVVSFVAKQKDSRNDVVLGIITRIIRKKIR